MMEDDLDVIKALFSDKGLSKANCGKDFDNISWKGRLFVCDTFDGKLRVTKVICSNCEFENNRRAQEVLNSISNLAGLQYLSLNSSDFRNTHLSASWGDLPLTYLQLRGTGIDGSIPCGLNASRIFTTKDFVFGDRQCLPLCYYSQYSRYTIQDQYYYSAYDDDSVGSTKLGLRIEGIALCQNYGCFVTQYADLASQPAKCMNCPSGFLASEKFSNSPDDCVNPAMNFIFSIIVLLVSIAAIVGYAYCGRIHRVSFVRMERVVHVLIKKYKITIAALKSFQGYLKHEPRNAASTAAGVAHHHINVLIFWVSACAILLFLPIILFLFVVWRRLLDVLILWNGFKEATSNFELTVDETISAIARNLSMPFVKELFEPLQQILDFLSNINLVDLDPINLTCRGAQAPFYLLIQVLVFGVTIIVISSDYQVFKMNLFGSLLDTFKGVTASRSYRRFVLTQDERFHWSPYRYLCFLVYAAIAELVSFSLDFTTILKFCISLISYNGIKFQIASTRRSILLFLISLWIVPFGFGLFTLSKSAENTSISDNACDYSDEWLFADTILSTITFCVSVYVIIIFFYEIGKAIVPGNRAMHLAVFKPAPRVEPYRSVLRECSSMEIAKRARRQFVSAYDRSLWALSFISGDLYIAALAEKWLDVVHTAIPPSVLHAAQPHQNQPAASSPAVNKRASLGWSAVMQTAELQSSSDQSRCCGLSRTNVFLRIFSDSQNQNLTVSKNEGPSKDDFNEQGTISQGYCTRIHSDRTMEGYFKDGKLTEFGRCTFHNGDFYIGEWIDNKFNGIGLFKVGKVIHLGSFRQGISHGRILICDNALRGHLKWRASDFDNGTLVSSSGKLGALEYVGERNDRGQKHGKGSWNQNGEFYSGEYFEDERHGHGICFSYNDNEIRGFSGEWKRGVKYGKGIEFLGNRSMVRGDWENGIKMAARRVALDPAHSEEEEQRRWEEFKSDHALPTYSEFISYQYEHFQTFSPCCIESWMPIRLIFKCIAALFVWYGLGNFLRKSRSIWYQIIRNYYVFIVAAMGIWTSEARLLFAVDECIETTNITEESEKEQLEASDKWRVYARAWSSILAPRFILFMVVPYLTPVMLYSTIMAPTPLYIADPQVPLPPLFDFESYYRRSARDEAIDGDQEWIAVVDAIYLFATESRIIQTFINAFKFAFSVAVWQAGFNKKILQIEKWAVAAIIILLPYCFMLSLKPIVYLGKTLNIKNRDVFFRGPKRATSFSSSRDTDPVDIVPLASFSRPSMSVNFDSIYAAKDLPAGNHYSIDLVSVELNSFRLSSTQDVRSPLQVNSEPVVGVSVGATAEEAASPHPLC